MVLIYKTKLLKHYFIILGFWTVGCILFFVLSLKSDFNRVLLFFYPFSLIWLSLPMPFIYMFSYQNIYIENNKLIFKTMAGFKKVREINNLYKIKERMFFYRHYRFYFENEKSIRFHLSYLFYKRKNILDIIEKINNAKSSDREIAIEYSIFGGKLYKN